MICRDCRFFRRKSFQVEGSQDFCAKHQEPTYYESQRLCFTPHDHPLDGKLEPGKKYYVQVTPLVKNTRVNLVVRTKLGPVAGGFLIPKEKWDPNNFALFVAFMDSLPPT